jgi:hypothetical protein
MSELDKRIDNHHNHSGHYSVRAYAYFLAACNLEYQDNNPERNNFLQKEGVFAEGYFKYVYGYLFTLSLELLLKAIIFADSIYEKANTYTSVYPDHINAILIKSVYAIAQKNSFPITPLEDKFLKKLGDIMIWGGRFPFPGVKSPKREKQEEKIKETIADAFNSGSGFPVSPMLTAEEITQVKNLYCGYSALYKNLEDAWCNQLRNSTSSTLHTS